jgi:hypothetical protein
LIAFVHIAIHRFGYTLSQLSYFLIKDFTVISKLDTAHRLNIDKSIIHKYKGKDKKISYFSTYKRITVKINYL